MTKDEALLEAIYVIEAFERGCDIDDYFMDTKRAIQACKDALTETQEPVAWINTQESGEYDTVYKCPKCSKKYSVQAEDTFTSMECACGFSGSLYTTPPSREWVGLSDAEITHIGISCQSLHQVARAIEDKLRAKNG